jgi:hypothetical protein
MRIDRDPEFRLPQDSDGGFGDGAGNKYFHWCGIFAA